MIPQKAQELMKTVKMSKLYQPEACKENKDFWLLTEELLSDRRVQRMNSFIQHGRVTTYRHCVAVALLCYAFSRRSPIRIDNSLLLRAAILHDYYLYDWHTHNDRLHGFHHPSIAAKNARKDFCISQKEADMIRSHMWPLTLLAVPRSREALLLCLADKICSSYETVMLREN